MRPLPTSLIAYRAATSLLQPAAPWLLRRRARRGKEDPGRIGERLGWPGLTRPPGPLVWLHGASVGENLSLLPLVEALRARRPDLGLLVTSGTVTSAELMARRLPPGVLHQFTPVDTPAAAQRFIAHWRPDLGVLAESELWPNLILTAQAQGTRLALVSARLSARSLAGWRRFPGAARRLVSAFSLIMAQDEATADGLSALGARDDGRLNLKLIGAPLPVDEEALASVRRAVDGRPVLLAASTHPGEDEVVVDAFAGLAARTDRPLLVVVPRHPVRGPEVAAVAVARGLATGRQGAGHLPVADQAVYVADALGELGLWFRLAQAALIGGSLVEGVGGHNPLEAARLHCPILSGSFVENWSEVFAGLRQAGALVQVQDAPGLALAFGEALKRPEEARARADRASAFADQESGALEAAVVRLLALLDEGARP